jgi:hypothetical protein
MDERYGYAGSKKKEPFWGATAIDPESRLLIGFVGGRRNEALSSRSLWNPPERG